MTQENSDYLDDLKESNDNLDNLNKSNDKDVTSVSIVQDKLKSLSQFWNIKGHFGITNLATCDCKYQTPLNVDPTDVQPLEARRIKKDQVIDEKMRSFQSQINLLKDIKEVFIANIVDLCQDGHYIYIIQEKVNRKQTLYDKICKCENPAKVQPYVEKISEQLMDAIGFMYTKGIAHLNLNPRSNVLLVNGFKVLITDYGLKHVVPLLAQNKQLTEIDNNIVLPYYIAPEVLDGNGGIESDIWSLGVIMFEMCFKYNPFDLHRDVLHSTGGLLKANGDMNDYDAVSRLIKQGFSPQIELGRGPWFPSKHNLDNYARMCGLISRMIVLNPKNRVTLPFDEEFRMIEAYFLADNHTTVQRADVSDPNDVVRPLTPGSFAYVLQNAKKHCETNLIGSSHMDEQLQLRVNATVIEEIGHHWQSALGRTGLMIAVEERNGKVVSLLKGFGMKLQDKYNRNVKDSSGRAAAHYLARWNGDCKGRAIYQDLVSMKCDFNIFDNYGWLPLHYQCKTWEHLSLMCGNEPDCVTILTQAKDKQKQKSGLMIAIENKNIPLVARLYKNKAAKELLTTRMAFEFACESNIDIFKMFDKNGCNFNEYDENGWNIIHHVCKANAHRSLRWIIGNNVCSCQRIHDYNNDKTPQTPLMIAQENGASDCVNTIYEIENEYEYLFKIIGIHLDEYPHARQQRTFDGQTQLYLMLSQFLEQNKMDINNVVTYRANNKVHFEVFQSLFSYIVSHKTYNYKKDVDTLIPWLRISRKDWKYDYHKQHEIKQVGTQFEILSKDAYHRCIKCGNSFNIDENEKIDWCFKCNYILCPSCSKDSISHADQSQSVECSNFLKPLFFCFCAG